MWKYIVFWVVSTWVSDPCPDIKYNQYTREYTASVCLVYHGHFEYDTLIQEFPNRDEAFDFVEGGKKEIAVTSIWIDSLKVEN